MLKTAYTKSYKKDYKRMMKRGVDETPLDEIITALLEQKPLPKEARDHLLIGNYKGCRECHIQPNWLLIYRVKNNTLELLRTLTHSDLGI